VTTNERILLFGQSGMGKSRAGLSIARRTKGKVWVIDSDFEAWARSLEHNPDIDNVVVENALDWAEYKSALTKFEGMVSPGDWLVVDMVGPAWDAAQQFFIKEIHGVGDDEYFIAQRKDLKAGSKNLGALSGWLDWPVINRIYRNWIINLLRLPCHLIATTTLERVNQETDERTVRDAFGPLGGKPGGQKLLAHQFHTVLLMHKAAGQWVMTTAKDREREFIVAKPVSDFAVSYLMSVAKWRP
jgi:AAA domain-containing protein